MTLIELREMCAKIADEEWNQRDSIDTMAACDAIAKNIQAIQLPVQEPVAFIQLIDGLKTKNFARNESELNNLKAMHKLFTPNSKVEYKKLYAAPPSSDNYKFALDEWLDKTEWVQKTATAYELGKHRADVINERIAALENQVAELKTRLNQNVSLLVNETLQSENEILLKQVAELKLSLRAAIETIDACGISFSEESMKLARERAKC